MIRRVPVEGAGRWLSRDTVRVFSPNLGGVALLAVAALAGLATIASGATLLAGYGVFVSVCVALLALWWMKALRTLRRHNAAVTALGAGDHEGARTTFDEVVSGLTPVGYAAPSLHNLGYLAQLEGDFRESAALLAAANAALDGNRSPQLRPLVALIRARWAMSLARVGQLDEAEALVADLPVDTPESRALSVLARAFVDHLRGRHEAVVAQLDHARPLLLRCLVGFNAATAAALEALSVRQLDGIYRGAARRSAELPCSEPMRAMVDRLLPGATTVLPRGEAWS